MVSDGGQNALRRGEFARVLPREKQNKTKTEPVRDGEYIYGYMSEIYSCETVYSQVGVDAAVEGWNFFFSFALKAF